MDKKRIISTLFTLSVLLFSFSAKADDATSFSSEKKEAEEKEVPKSLIAGDCEMLASASNPITGPCVSIFLLLLNDKGEELSTTRTDESGNFSFSIDQEKKMAQYRIDVKSKFYELVAPKDLVRSKQKIHLQLRQK